MSQTIQEFVTKIGIGGIAAPVILGFASLAVGLSPAGPIAGGWFAANMGSGLVAGSAVSVMQSVVMTALK